MHVSEREKTSNTARLLELTLPNCEVLIIGKKGKPFKGVVNSPEETPYILFPEQSALPLTKELSSTNKFEGRPIHLIVPDGSWSQTRRIVHRNVFLRGIPRIQLIGIADTKYLLRRNGRVGGVCTAEAVAYALGIIENAAIETTLICHFTTMRDRVLESRFSLHAGRKESPKDQLDFSSSA